MSVSRGIYNKRGSGTIRNGYRLIVYKGKQRGEHIAICEKALGKELPKNAIVHHLDNNRSNNANNNLLVCPSQQYHLLIHLRQRALDACGNADFRLCSFCKKYDDPLNMQKNGRSYRHASCIKEYNKRYLVGASN